MSQFVLCYHNFYSFGISGHAGFYHKQYDSGLDHDKDRPDLYQQQDPGQQIGSLFWSLPFPTPLGGSKK